MTERVEIAAVWMPEDAQRAGAVLAELGPLFEDYWLRARPPGHPGFNFNVEAFVRGWRARDLVLVVARANGVAVGFALMAMGGNYFCNVKNAYMLHVYRSPSAAHLQLGNRTLDYLRQLMGALDVDYGYIESRRGAAKLFYCKKGT